MDRTFKEFEDVASTEEGSGPDDASVRAGCVNGPEADDRPLGAAPHSEEWPDISVRLGPVDPLIPPGDYDAYASSYESVSMRVGNQVVHRLVLLFEIRGGPHHGARLRFFLPLPPRNRSGFLKSLAPSSKLYRSWVVANNGRHPARRDRLSLDVFRHKLFRIRVRTTISDRTQQTLAACNQYSVVEALL